MSPFSYARGKRVWRQRHQTPFLLSDHFAVPNAGPFASPRIAEPGPGSWLVSDADLRMTIPAGGGLLYGPPAGAGAWDRTMLAATTPFARKAGLYCEFEITPTNTAYFRAGWNLSQGTSGGTGGIGAIAYNEAAIYLGGGGFINVTDGLDVASPLYPYTPGTSYTFRIYDTGAGWLYYVRPTANADAWVILWERTHGFPHLPHFTPHTNGHSLSGSLSHFIVRQGMVKPPLLSVPAPDAFSTIFFPGADGLYSGDFTARPGFAGSLIFRQVDYLNYWYVSWHLDTNTMRLVKVINQAETTVAVTSVIWKPGATYHLRVLLFGNHIRTFYGVQSGPSTDDPYLQTATGVSCGFDGPLFGDPPGDGQNLQFRGGGAMLLN